jgi:hypothetical protein
MTPINFSLPGFFKKSSSGAAEFNEDAPPITDDLLVFFDPEYGVFSDDGHTLAVDGDNIRQLWDRSATGNTLNQTTASSQPLYNTTVIGNGKASIQSNNDFFLTTNNIEIPNTQAEWTFYAVYKRSSLSHEYYISTLSTNSLCRMEWRTVHMLRQLSGSGRFTSFTDDLDTKIVTYTLDRNAGTVGELKMYVNGSLYGTMSSGTQVTNWPLEFNKLFSAAYGVNFGNQLWYNDAHSADQVLQVSNWLNDKYDIYDPYAPPITDDLEIYFNPDFEVYSDAGTTLATDGDNIRQYNDRSGNDNTAEQITGSKQPVYSTSTLGNGNASIHIDSTNVFDLTSGITVGSSSHFTYYTVYKKSAGTRNSAIGNDSGTDRIDLRDSYIQTFDSSTNSFEPYSWSTDLVIITVVVDSSDNSYKVYENGSQVGATNTRTFGQFDFNQLHGGASTGGDVDYGITLMYNGVAHDSTDVGTISDWLNDKYSVY